MAYATGIYTSPDDLLATISTFAAARGWTINTNSGVNTGGAGFTNKQRSFTSDSLTVNIVPDTGLGGALKAQPSTAWVNNSTAFYNHTGSPNTSGNVSTTVNMNQIGTGSGVAYHLFGNDSSPRYVHVVVEVTAGVYSHFAFGTLTKYGTYTGGGYVTSLSWSVSNWSQIGLPFSAINRNTTNGTQWVRADSLVGLGSPGWREDFGGLSNNAFTQRLHRAGLSTAWQRSPLGPILCFAFATETTNPTTTNVCLGEVQDMRGISMEGREPGESLVIGGDTWRVFPTRNKSNPASSPAAYNITTTTTTYLGIAYRVV